MRLRFTIHDLFWLMVVVSLAVGWWLNGRWMAADFESQKAQLRRDTETLSRRCEEIAVFDRYLKLRQQQINAEAQRLGLREEDFR
jgi:hypothetical protein